ncbi:MAG: hypothetical protein IJ877_02990 [Candidatus Gastranaerophilales bacterium]|nr:hypothetical protein [Candidatus Gastranaerophilales bacterium]
MKKFFIIPLAFCILMLICKPLREFVKNIFQYIFEKLAIVILFIVFYIGVIPTKLLMAMFKRDRLRLKENKNSYWLEAKNDHDYELQY